ncbi:hypothetical protein AB0I81_45810 [Nonomuraea sp. NPDC050404]|uniref:hypothetical protein n=1 Tax=Nonomuraea sp. NPDC050404 TaxID=3155783 RepID=UPI00340ED576
MATYAAGDGLLHCQAITGEALAGHTAALDQVLTHLTASGINAQLIMREAATRCPIMLYATGERLWHPPVLKIYANAGWKAAAISVGARSGCYFVELPYTPGWSGRDNPIEIISANHPDRVASFVSRVAGVSA